MADWFKIYSVDLDETRMRYAMSKLPEVWPVWTAVLMECCKHRSGEFRWGTGEHELFGFSDRLKISISKVNQAIQLLCEIKYCERCDETLKVLKWNEKQDDYLQRKSQGYWKKRGEIKKVTVNHSDSHIEERRVEEKREESVEAHAPEVAIPTLTEIKAYASMHGIKAESAQSFYDHHEGNSLWLNQYGRLINWKAKLVSWGARDNAQPRKGPNGTARAPFLSELKLQLDTKKELRQKIRNRGHEDAGGLHVLEADKEEFRRLNSEIAQLMNQIDQYKP